VSDKLSNGLLGQLQLFDEKCQKEIAGANRHAEKVSDHACLASWLAQMKEAHDLGEKNKPLIEQEQKITAEFEKVTKKLIEVILAKKK
jgi:hypothetical protein